jgi:hypothetical protein
MISWLVVVAEKKDIECPRLWRAFPLERPAGWEKPRQLGLEDRQKTDGREASLV